MFKALYEFIKTNISHVGQTYALAGAALKKRYSGSLFGWAWSVVRPIVFIVVYWFAISIGIRGNKPVELIHRAEDCPYILWMIPGVIAWFAMQEALTNGVACIRSNSHLVNKMVFPIATIPVFSVISYFFSHLLMLTLAIAVFLISGFGLTVYFVQIIWYFILFFCFCCLTATFVGTLGVVSRDFEQLVKAVMNVVFWLTPVLWELSRLDSKSHVLAQIMKLNPFYYFVNGYRDAFLGEAWFWEYNNLTPYMIVFMICFALLTCWLFKKLSKEFADVL